MCGEPRLIPFTTIEQPLRQLLVEFGPPRQSVHPEYPFWRLQNDGLWQVEAQAALEPRKASSDRKKSELVNIYCARGFPEPIHALLAEDPHIVAQAAEILVSRHFPASLRAASMGG